MTTIHIGEDHATITMNSGTILTARILDKKVEDGKVTEVLLDRRIHESYSRYYGWNADGAFVTKLTSAY